jgi:cytochrome c-type biogenesis protein CcmF
VLLQDNLLVAIHPPLIYSGLVLFTVPFALVIGTLAAGRLGDAWHADTRRWALTAWTFLTVGILLGAWWSYQVLGWGGFWGWDPVENAALLPWLVGTAYVHSVVVEERRGLLRVWNLTLAISVFSLTILATYLTRSGVLQSVHAFSSSTLGGLLLGFLALVLASGLGLLAWRGDKLRSPIGIDAPLSREGAFVANNVLFVGFALVVLLGTVFPLGYQAIEHSTVTVGPPYFDSVALPVGLCVLFLMAIAPALGWRQVDGWVLWHRVRTGVWAGAVLDVALVADGVRGIGTLIAFLLATIAAWSAIRALTANVQAAHQRAAPLWHGLLGRSSGGMVVHLGVVLATVAIVCSASFSTRATVELAPGQSRSVGGHSVDYEAVQVVRSPVRTATELVVRVDGGGLFYPAISRYAGGPVQTPAIDSSLLGDDVYLTYVPVGQHGEVALSVTVEPYVSWLWVGGLVAGLGGALALARAPRRRRQPEPVVAEPIRELEPV